jgi:hypothetical protein
MVVLTFKLDKKKYKIPNIAQCTPCNPLNLMIEAFQTRVGTSEEGFLFLCSPSENHSYDVSLCISLSLSLSLSRQ